MADTFEASMATLAEAIATKAASEDTSLAEKIDAIRALTPYLTLRLKQNESKQGEALGETSFADFAAEINGTGEMKDGASPVRGRTRRAPKHAS